MLKKILSVLAVVALLCTMCVTVFADAPDFSKTGTITLTMRHGEDPVSGGTLAAIRIGEAHEDDGNYSFRLIGDFAVNGEFPEDLMSKDLADEMAAIAKEKNISGVEKTIAADGTVTFSDLELGLYLFVQTKNADGYYYADPFIMGVPQYVDETYVYEVDASPKVGVEPEPTTVTTTAPPPPQTGQLNWPVPVMAVGGLALFVCGFVLCRVGKKEHNEE